MRNHYYTYRGLVQLRIISQVLLRLSNHFLYSYKMPSHHFGILKLSLNVDTEFLARQEKQCIVNRHVEDYKCAHTSTPSFSAVPDVQRPPVSQPFGLYHCLPRQGLCPYGPGTRETPR